MSSEPKGLAQDIDLHIKVYIDDAYQATITTLVDKVKELINQQAENQKRWNEQIQRTINDRFNKLEQVAVMAYDEDRHLVLAMDCDLTLFDRNIEAKEENFNELTIRRAKFNRPRAPWSDAI
ncbi:hypothetical protein C2G38_2166972 [Gigaspora rosea]|uniref:Uncharacterized protein n=1 Tax=Gigaspora rosea TaxID=44941 RepID=A0A397VTG3_9GLOM|nr:hypothetical protein C2G38_2166972 [Gigaspora rosea]